MFLSYNGLLEPILPSQAVPYLKELAGKGYEFVLLTYEKKKDLKRAGNAGLAKIRRELNLYGITWRYMVYHKNPPVLSTFFDLVAGTFVALGIVLKERIRIIHVRGITPGMMVMALSKLLRIKILFDMRGLLAEEYVGGGLWTESSIRFRMVKNAEKKMLKKADAVTVLTQKHLELNKRLDYLKDRGIPMDVVPCCVDVRKFDYHGEPVTGLKKELGLDGKFVVMYPGKIGTFYLIDEMLDFFKVMSDRVPNAVFLVVTNDEPGELVKRAGVIGIREGNVRAVNGVPFEEMPDYLRIADAGLFFINPYKKLGSSPIKMGEFLASGVPVVINPGVGDTEEMVRGENVGVVVERFSGEDYARAIDGLFRLKEEGEDLRKRCRTTAIRYLSLELAVGKYDKIYKLLAGAER
jgi:glycosyltransferase involved in cell wall biosynthesis